MTGAITRENTPRLAVAVAATGLAMLALFATSPGLGWLNARNGAILLLLGTFGMGGRPWRELGRHPIVQLLLLFTIYVVLQAVVTHWRMPSIGIDVQLAAASKPLKLIAWACLIGWWLVERPRWLMPALSLLLLGLAGWIAIHVPWDHLSLMFAGRLRLRPGGYAPNLAGLFSALAVLIVTLRLVGGQDTSVRWRAVLHRLILGLALTLFVAFLLFAQSRGAWLALLVVLPGSVYWVWRRPGAAVARRRFWPMIIILILFVAAAGTYLTRPVVWSRFDHGEKIVHALERDDFAALNTSVGIRLNLYRFGLQKWSEAPLTGWGLASIQPMLARSRIQVGTYIPPHLHDIYLQTAVGLGGIGLVLLLLPLVLWLRDLWWACGYDPERRIRNVILLGSLSLVLVANLFDCLLWTNGYMRMPISLLLAGAMAVSLQRRRVEELLSRPVPKVLPHAAATTV